MGVSASYGDQLLFLQNAEAGSPVVALGKPQEPSSCPEVTTGSLRDPLVFRELLEPPMSFHSVTLKQFWGLIPDDSAGERRGCLLVPSGELLGCLPYFFEGVRWLSWWWPSGEQLPEPTKIICLNSFQLVSIVLLWWLVVCFISSKPLNLRCLVWESGRHKTHAA